MLGKLVGTAVISHGPGIINNNIIKNIAFNDFYGVGIAVYGANMTISNNTFSGIGRDGIFVALDSIARITDNTYIGKGNGDWVDFGIGVGENSTATISGNNISGNTGVSTEAGDSYGIAIYGYDDAIGTPTSAVITNNIKKSR